MGGPGSGKGELGKRLAEEHGLEHVSAGDLLREEEVSYTRNSDIIRDSLSKGAIVPANITVGLLKKAMIKRGWNTRKFLIDGYPPNKANDEEWNKVMKDIADVKFVIFLDCDEETMTERVK